MKKKFGYIMSWITFSIGSIINKISYTKYNGKYFFDKKGIRYKIGYWLAGQYQNFMSYSSNWQDWGGDGVWQNVADGTNS